MFLILEQPYFPKSTKIVKHYKSGKVIVETKFQTFKDTNRNGRVYSKEAILEATRNEGLQERMKNKTFGGELDHPIPTSDDTYTQVRHTTLLFKEMSHIIPELHIDDNEVTGIAETTSTPNGFTMAGLISDGIRVGFSLRAIGQNVENQNGVELVKPPVIMIAYDCVSFPSHKQAYMTEIKKWVTESTINEAKRIHCKDGVCSLLDALEFTSKDKELLLEQTTKNKLPGEIYNLLKSTTYHIV